MKPLITFILIISSLSSFSQKDELNELFLKAYIYRKNADSAIHFSKKAFVLSREIGFKEGMGLSKLYAGIGYYNANKMDTAISLLSESLPYASESNFTHGLNLHYQGKIQKDLGSFDRCTTLLKKAHAEYLSADSILLSAQVWSSLGVIEGMQGNYTEALNYFIEAYQTKSDLGENRDASIELNNIAIVYKRMRNFPKALEYIRESIALEDSIDLDNSYNTIGSIYHMMENMDSAIYFFHMAITESLKKFDTLSFCITATNLGLTHLKIGNHSEALRFQRLALDFSQKAKLNTIRGATLGALAQTYIELENSDSTYFYLKQAMSFAKKEKSKGLLRDVSDLLSQYFSRLKKYDSAFYYLNQHMIYADSISGESANKKFSDQRVKFETLKKQAEIDVLEEQNKLLKYKRQTLLLSVGISAALIIISFFWYRTSQIKKRKKLNDEKRRLELELENKKSLLSAHTLNMIHRKNGFDEIENQLVGLKGEQKRKISTIIKVNKALEKDWDNFSNYFSQVHADFFEKINKRFADLSQSEIRLCALIKLNLVNKEVATLLNIEQKSVNMARYRLKKKLGLDDDSDLNNYIQQNF